jgi:hypothetical protein
MRTRASQDTSPRSRSPLTNMQLKHSTSALDVDALPFVINNVLPKRFKLQSRPSNSGFLSKFRLPNTALLAQLQRLISPHVPTNEQHSIPPDATIATEDGKVDHEPPIDLPNDNPVLLEPDKNKAKPKIAREAAPCPLATRHTRRLRPARKNDGVTRRADSCTPYSNYMRHRVRRKWQVWKNIGASGQVLKWIREGVTIPFLNNRLPPPFNQGVSLLDDTPK